MSQHHAAHHADSAQDWDEDWFGSTKTLDVHMVALRRKLAAAAAASGPSVVAGLPKIATLRGHGYRLDLSASTAAGGSPSWPARRAIA